MTFYQSPVPPYPHQQFYEQAVSLSADCSRLQELAKHLPAAAQSRNPLSAETLVNLAFRFAHNAQNTYHQIHQTLEHSQNPEHLRTIASIAVVGNAFAQDAIQQINQVNRALPEQDKHVPDPAERQMFDLAYYCIADGAAVTGLEATVRSFTEDPYLSLTCSRVAHNIDQAATERRERIRIIAARGGPEIERDDEGRRVYRALLPAMLATSNSRILRQVSDNMLFQPSPGLLNHIHILDKAQTTLLHPDEFRWFPFQPKNQFEPADALVAVIFIHDGLKHGKLLDEPYPAGFPADLAADQMRHAVENMRFQKDRCPPHVRQQAHTMLRTAHLRLHDITGVQVQTLLTVAGDPPAQQALITAAADQQPDVAARLAHLGGTDISKITPRQVEAATQAILQLNLPRHMIAAISRILEPNINPGPVNDRLNATIDLTIKYLGNDTAEKVRELFSRMP